MLPRLLAPGDDIYPGVFLQLYPQPGGVAFCMGASRYARASFPPADFRRAHGTLGSPSHSGFGSEPAIVVGNSMGVPLSFLILASICPVPGGAYMGLA